MTLIFAIYYIMNHAVLAVTEGHGSPATRRNRTVRFSWDPCWRAAPEDGYAMTSAYDEADILS